MGILLQEGTLNPHSNSEADTLFLIAFHHIQIFSCFRQVGFAKDYKKLGFKCDINPALDFAETPPGMLALDCMIYFARNHVENYTKVCVVNN